MTKFDKPTREYALGILAGSIMTQSTYLKHGSDEGDEVVTAFITLLHKRIEATPTEMAVVREILFNYLGGNTN
jgi:hypothetical protein